MSACQFPGCDQPAHWLYPPLCREHGEHHEVPVVHRDRRPLAPAVPAAASADEVGEPPVPAPPAGTGGDHRLSLEEVLGDGGFTAVVGRCSCHHGWQGRAANAHMVNDLFRRHVVEGDEDHHNIELARVIGGMIHRAMAEDVEYAARCLARVLACDPKLHAAIITLRPADFAAPQVDA